MDPDVVMGAAVIYLVGMVLALVLSIVWIILPFAIFGTKPLLRELIAEVRQLRIVLARREDQIPVLGIRSDVRP
jgi:hypothetical protein